MRHSRPLYPNCVCSVGQESTTQWVAGSNLQLFTKVAGTHSRACPLFSSSWQTNTIGIKYVHAAALLRGPLELSLTATRGAGGFFFSPLIQVRGFVRNDSPAFKLVHDLNLKLCLPTLVILNWKLQKLPIRQIKWLFDEGKAKPGDVNTEGATILGVSLVPLLNENLTDSFVWVEGGYLWYRAFYEDPQKYLLYQRFFLFLAQLGVPVDEVDSGGR